MDDLQAVDFKFVESYLKDKFSRPFARRLKYIYLGLDHCEDTFVLSDTEDTDFKYCESMQTTGLVKIKNPEHLRKVLQWFDNCKIDRKSPCIFYFSRVATLLNKMAWSDPAIKVVRHPDGIVTMSTPGFEDIIVARPIDTHFTLTRLQGFVDKYNKVFFENDGFYHDVEPSSEKVTSLSSLSISCLDLYEAGILDAICEDIKLVLLSGLDLLVAKSLIAHEADYKYGVRLWADNGKKCLNYGSFYTDADLAICSCRDNIFIFPVAKKEPQSDNPRPVIA